MSCPPRFWDGVLLRLRSELPSIAFDAWVRPLRVEEHEGRLLLLCPSPFHRDRVRLRYLDRIAGHVETELGRRLAIDLGLAKQGEPAPPEAEVATPAQPVVRPPKHPAGAQGKRRCAGPRQAAFDHSFENFIVGPSNALAREASYALAHRRQAGLSPLYLSSAPGLGKTHLARAVARAAQANGSRVVYESAEAFTSRFMTALRQKSMEDFKRRYRRECDLLVLEDLEFLKSKAATQLELFHTLTHLADAGAAMVLTGDRLPRDIDGLDARLRSQITAGLVAEIEPPDAAVRRSILRAKAAAGGVRLPDDCLDLLVESVRGSVRDLEGALIQLVTSSSLMKRQIDQDLTRMALHKLAPTLAPARCLDVQTVVGVVAQFFGITRESMASRSRRRDVLLPRKIAMYLCRRYTDASLTQIAGAFDRDHPSASNAVKTVERQILERAPLRYRIEELTARLDRIREG